MRISDWSSDVCSSDLIFTLGIGYRPDEYELHGVEYRRRGAIADEKLEILLQHLRAASSGDAAVRVTPAPFTAGGPMVTWGGPTPQAAQRRSAERSVGKECVSTCRSQWSADH